MMKVKRIMIAILTVAMMLSLSVPALACPGCGTYYYEDLKDGSHKESFLYYPYIDTTDLYAIVWDNALPYEEIVKKFNEEFYIDCARIIYQSDSNATVYKHVAVEELSKSASGSISISGVGLYSGLPCEFTLYEGGIIAEDDQGNISRGENATISFGYYHIVRMDEHCKFYYGSDKKVIWTITETYNRLDASGLYYVSADLVSKNGKITEVVIIEDIPTKKGSEDNEYVSDWHKTLKDGTYDNIALFGASMNQFVLFAIFWEESGSFDSVIKYFAQSDEPDFVEVTYSTDKGKEATLAVGVSEFNKASDDVVYLSGYSTDYEQSYEIFVRDDKITIEDGEGKVITGTNPQCKPGIEYTVSLDERCKFYNGNQELSFLEAYAAMDAMGSVFVDIIITSEDEKITKVVFNPSNAGDGSADAIQEKVEKSSVTIKPTKYYDSPAAYTVTSKSGVYRSGPHTDYKKLGKLKKNETVYAYADQKGQYGKWYLIETESGKIGWVSKDLIQMAE